MTEQDLDRLKRIPIPEPSPGARERALDAAWHAFEAEGEKLRSRPKGAAGLARLMAISIADVGRWTMQRPMMIGTVAATLIALPLAAQLLVSSNLVPLRLESEPEIAQPGVLTPEPQQQAAKDADTEASPQGKMTAESLIAALKRRQERGGLQRAIPTQPLADAQAMRERRAYAPSPTTPGAGAVAPLGGAVMPATRGVARDLLLRPELPSRDQFASFTTNGVKSTATDPVSTFSIDVDTASYAFMRRTLERGALPAHDAVRVEEMINYFSYDYPRPDSAEAPFRASVSVYPTPWNPATRLLHIGIKGYDVAPAAKPASNLVFLIDVSGSMAQTDKLPLLKSAFRLLLDRLSDDDTVAIVTYAGAAGTALEPTKVKERAKILAAIDGLRSGGSTAGEQGIRQAYALAEQGLLKDGVNRVILATDGDFNVGLASPDELKSLIETKRKSGVFLSVLGFGQGNYNDALMQTLAQNGNGTAAYIDSLREAQKVLVEEASATLFPIAKDVKIQVEFNPEAVAEYRLIGYETRALARADFNNDKVDAGDIGSGHTVTAIYEITPAGSSAALIDGLRYGQPTARPAPSTPGPHAGEYAFLKLRYKLPAEETSKLITLPVTHDLERPSVDALPEDMRFAAAVAAFGQKLRGVSQLEDYSYDSIIALADGARGRDAYGYRGEFVSLVRLAKSLSGSAPAAASTPR